MECAAVIMESQLKIKDAVIPIFQSTMDAALLDVGEFIG
jgi:hypothetical protein